ncbi:putative ATH1 acid trehalase [Coleophoma cylindrospora]|uniref:alpha,alpha-trehalase n=1 Tax=Coleophoma cylindrospora TaxID=1849047 RepID=A0A3D8S0H9_9HELO|nr:putative ATH1 acid trehalase [Coleophoma cylindrospora]
MAAMSSRLILRFCWAASLWSTAVLAATDFSVLSAGLSTWNQTDWSLTCRKLVQGQYQSRISLSNGYVGASLASIGPFFERDVNQTDANGLPPLNGWPLFDERLSFSTISGFFDVQQNTTGSNYPWLYQYGYDSFISGIPHPTAIIFAFGDEYLDATVSNTTISDFSSKMSFKTGTAEWTYTWTPAKLGTSFNVSYTAFFSRARPNVIGVKASIVPSTDINGTATDLLDGQSAYRSYLAGKGVDQNGSTVYTSVHPNGLANITGVIVSGASFVNAYTNASSRSSATGGFLSGNETTIGQTYDISLKSGETATFYKYVGVASSDKFQDPFSTARSEQSRAQSVGWDTLLSEHIAAWAELLPEDSVDDFRDPITGKLPDDPNIEMLQIASVANPYYLIQAMMPDGSGLNDDGVSVGGLVSDSYAGQVFWDMDYWMAPGLNLAFPSLAKQIVNFRVKQYPQALANAAFNNYPDGSTLYSWTAGRYGNCTGTGPCVDYEYHLNYDISFNILQLKAITSNETWFESGPLDVINGVTVMTSHLLEFNDTTGSYWIHNMTDPDEYANNIDNGAFTIASAAVLLAQANSLLSAKGQAINQTWVTQQNIEFPKAPSSITLEYTGMNNSAAVKQADVVLLTYPLDYTQNYSTADRLLDLDYYANKQSPDGPAMTYSVFAVDANALSPSGCSAYTYALNGLSPYLRAPWYQFSEQAVDNVELNGGTNPAFPFLTGHGGANQIVPFGFLGVRTTQPVLFIDPSLPPQIPFVKIRTIYFAGSTLSAIMNQTHTTLTRLTTPSSSGLTDTYANTTFPLSVGQPSSGNVTNYTLSINVPLTIPNRVYFQNLTVPGNLLQCQPVSSTDSYAAGQFPVAAIDGATATKWQPATNASASLLVNLTAIPAGVAIDEIYIDWATRPPKSATVYLGNSSEITGTGAFIFGNEAVISFPAIEPSIPYNATAAALSTDQVEPVVGNTTTLAIAGTWSGLYARLVIEGCWETDGVGATVAEFVIRRAGSGAAASGSVITTVTAASTSVASESATATVTTAPTVTTAGSGTGSSATSTSSSDASTVDMRGLRCLLQFLIVGFGLWVM